MEILNHWYRRQLQNEIPGLLARWEAAIGVRAAECRIKRMKTRWGDVQHCGPSDLVKPGTGQEAAGMPGIHPGVSLRLKRHHNDRFRALMDHHLPSWRIHRDRLNQAPLAHEDWEY